MSEKLRRYLRFTLRDLIWLTLIVAMAVGWWVDHEKLLSELDKLRQELYIIYHLR